MPSYAQTTPFPSDSPVAKPRYRDTGIDPLYRVERQYLDSLKPTWNLISVHLTQLLVREVQVSYERFVSRRLSLEVAGGIRIPNFDDNEVYSGMFAQDYDINYKAYPFIRSYYEALGFKWNLVKLDERPNLPVYLTVVPFYRYNFFDARSYSIPSGSSFNEAAYLQSKYQHISGVKAGIGLRFPVWHVDETHKFFLDVFAGAG